MYPPRQIFLDEEPEKEEEDIVEVPVFAGQTVLFHKEMLSKDSDKSHMGLNVLSL